MLFLTIFSLFCTSVSASPCLYGISLCQKNEACIKVDQENAKCIALPDETPEVYFPMISPKGTYCDQGNLSPEHNSHIYNNTAFALDLVSNRNFSPATIIASSSGRIISYSGCKTQNDQCGNGFGNYVQILRDDGVLIFYAHLAEVYVKTDDMIVAGEKIGIEGSTGWAGENNRHLHFSVHSNWKNMGIDTFKNNIGFLPSSIPFKMIFCKSDLKNCEDKTVLDSRKLKCTRVSNTIDWLTNSDF